MHILFTDSSYQNVLKESGVNINSDSFIMEIASKSKRAFVNAQLVWRNVLPFGDLDEAKILKTYCSSRYFLLLSLTHSLKLLETLMISMLKECRPSLRTGITVGYRNGRNRYFIRSLTHSKKSFVDTRDSATQPTQGQQCSVSLVSLSSFLNYRRTMALLEM